MQTGQHDIFSALIRQSLMAGHSRPRHARARKLPSWILTVPSALVCIIAVILAAGIRP